jgi:DNA-binding beta-propeller fold protein YncE
MRFPRLILSLSVAAVCAHAVAMAAERLFVAENGGTNVTEIDPEANRVVATIPVSAGPAGLAVWVDVNSTKRDRLYVSSTSKNLLEAVDLRAGKVVSSAPAGPKPGSLALSPDGRRVFICLGGQSGIDVLDTANLQKLRTIEIAEPSSALYVTPDLTRLIAAGGHRLTVINIRTEKPEFSIPLDGVAERLAIASDKNLVIHQLFVSVAGFRGFEVFDYTSRKMTGKIATPAAVNGMIVSPDRRTLWVSSDSVMAFSLPDTKKVAAIPTDGVPGDIACSGELKRCFVASSGGAISVIDAVAMKELQRIPVGKSPGRMILVE